MIIDTKYVSLIAFQVYYQLCKKNTMSILRFATTWLPPLFPAKGCSGEVKGTVEEDQGPGWLQFYT